ncbi:MAP3K12-binding inhibitory protein 1 isoform X1 [Ixodes scapularis]|uniref:MAP3K12-binding inhibitory protein 1 isoform X1 n=1 Tax=Ixodes scapularis TaxID=6945 RepID=UPI001A9D3E8C|nr:MAP3K12-binding inhibitory protein 1 isoform X1 [Ixodes scapularis]
MVETCLEQCSKLLSSLRDAGVLQSFKLEYDVAEHVVGPPKAASVQTAIHDFIKCLEDYKNKLSNVEVRAAVDPKIVQIQVNRKVIDDRIDAFITRKRKEVDDWNVQEFCSSKASEIDNETEYGCARVDAVFVPRSGGCSHVKVSRVVNQWGPMTKLMRPAHNPHGPTGSKEEEPAARIPEGIEERLRNMESHLKLKSGCSVPQDVYVRIKQLEDRILYLEGISPDYFMSSSTQGAGAAEPRRASGDTSRHYDDWSMSEIENRISLLQTRLREKVQDASEPSTSSMAL